MKLKHIKNYDPMMNKAVGRNIEKMVGCVQVPMGVAGPLVVDKKKYSVSIATTEGALVASVNRGCKAIRESGGCKVKVKEAGATRGPVFKVKGLRQGEELVNWVDKNISKIKKVARDSDRHLRLLKIRSQMVGRYVWFRLEFDTAEAMGMNMVTIATERVAELIYKELKIKCVSLSGNYCVDKKPSWLNMIEGRGKQVWVEVEVSEKVVKDVLKTNPEKIVEVVKAKQWLGSMVSGSMGFNAHYANIVAGVFLATGQDIAQVVEGSMGITTAEILRRREGSEPSFATLQTVGGSEPKPSCLYFSVYLPSLMVGTVGGGTGLPTQREALGIMGLGNKKGDAVTLAGIIGGAVLAGELSLTAALASNDLARAHQGLGRGK